MNKLRGGLEYIKNLYYKHHNFIMDPTFFTFMKRIIEQSKTS